MYVTRKRNLLYPPTVVGFLLPLLQKKIFKIPVFLLQKFTHFIVVKMSYLVYMFLNLI